MKASMTASKSSPALSRSASTAAGNSTTVRRVAGGFVHPNAGGHSQTKERLVHLREDAPLREMRHHVLQHAPDADGRGGGAAAALAKIASPVSATTPLVSRLQAQLGSSTRRSWGAASLPPGSAQPDGGTGMGGTLSNGASGTGGALAHGGKSCVNGNAGFGRLTNRSNLSRGFSAGLPLGAALSGGGPNAPPRAGMFAGAASDAASVALATRTQQSSFSVDGRTSTAAKRMMNGDDPHSGGAAPSRPSDSSTAVSPNVIRSEGIDAVDIEVARLASEAAAASAAAAAASACGSGASPAKPPPAPPHLFQRDHPLHARSLFRTGSDRNLKRVLVDWQLAMGPLLEKPAHRLVCGSIDGAYDFYRRHVQFEGRSDRKSSTEPQAPPPRFISFDANSPVMPGSLRRQPACLDSPASSPALPGRGAAAGTGQKPPGLRKSLSTPQLRPPAAAARPPELELANLPGDCQDPLSPVASSALLSPLSPMSSAPVCAGD